MTNACFAMAIVSTRKISLYGEWSSFYNNRLEFKHCTYLTDVIILCDDILFLDSCDIVLAIYEDRRFRLAVVLGW